MKETIDEAIRQADAGSLDFPGYIALLSSVGVHCYRVEMKTHTVVYYAGMKSLTRNFFLEDIDIASHFNVNILKEAILAAQQKKIVYIEFLKRIAHAGVEGFEVDFKSKEITYRGRRKFYIEPFKPANSDL